LLNINLENVNKVKSGKVRELFEVDDKFLLVATDRISAFDHILPQEIPEKGKLLNMLSSFWFDFLADIIENHKITDNVKEYPSELNEYKDLLSNRSMLVKKTKVINLECIVRGYLAGSAWKDYQQSGSFCGIKLPNSLRNSEKLQQPLFTPSTKAQQGEHDINVSEQEAKDIVGSDVFEIIKEKSLLLYSKARDYAESKGIIIADTKFEFGIYNNKIILIDEVLTPDSSRFWSLDKYQPGKDQPSLDKQFVRDYLLSINWNKKAPIPDLPVNIVNNTREKYIEAYKTLTGKNFY
jgi:phosphoribosylaminoimidazole-succinocarboxamide synthase